MKHHGNKKREWTACQQLKRQVRSSGVPELYHCATDASSLAGDI